MEGPEAGLPKPHEAAKPFADHVNSSHDDDSHQKAQELSDVILEDVPSSSRSFQNVHEPPAKRQKMAQSAMLTSATSASTTCPPRGLRHLVENDIAAQQGKPIVEIPVDVAEALQEKITELEAELKEAISTRDVFRDIADRTKEEVDGWSSIFNKIQPRFMEALKDRGIFEKERDDARQKAGRISTNLEFSKTKNNVLRQEVAVLKEKLSTATENLLTGSSPNMADMVRLQNEKDEAQAQTTRMEKKVSGLQTRVNYIRGLCQNTSDRGAVLESENNDLRAKVVELTRMADFNIVFINEMHSRNEVRELARLLEKEKAIVREREAELDRAKEQLSSLEQRVTGRQDGTVE